MRKVLAALTVSALTACAAAQAHPRDAEIHDNDTREWWHTTEALASDAMEGRDTGTAAYQRAADYVAQRFRAAGLTPAGDNGTFFQTVPMHQIDIDPAASDVSIWFGDRSSQKLRWLYDIVSSVPDAPTLNVAGELVFRGYCGKDAMNNVAGRIVVCFGTQRTGLPSAAERTANARAAGAAAVLNVDDPYFTIEPPRWPYAYARSVTLRNPDAPRSHEKPFLTLRCSVDSFAKLLSSTSHDAETILKAGGSRQPLESFDLPGRTLRAHIVTTEKDIASPNVLAVLPGTDPALKDQYLAVSAHLDGYGYGTPVKGDNLYNGALDDAAYVALLIQMADDLHMGRGRAAAESNGVDTRQYSGTTLAAPRRSILFCIFTGEEKGLLGSTWFVEHPTVPKAQLAADINLDQLRPIFPLSILTAPGIDLTSLGDIARKVAANNRIELRDDREPERGLLHRADNWPFLKAGIPAIGFVFGFDPGTDSERRYREWYQTRYHRPQDDLSQPMDFMAAARFNGFFYQLVETVANQSERPEVVHP